MEPWNLQLPLFVHIDITATITMINETKMFDYYAGEVSIIIDYIDIFANTMSLTIIDVHLQDTYKEYILDRVIVYYSVRFVPTNK